MVYSKGTAIEVRIPTTGETWTGVVVSSKLEDAGWSPSGAARLYQVDFKDDLPPAKVWEEYIICAVQEPSTK
jgi:hypothetical protein